MATPATSRPTTTTACPRRPRADARPRDSAYRLLRRLAAHPANGSGPTNRAGLDFYSRLVDGLLARGITPVVTLYHWDLPQALEDRGGWPARETAMRFGDYAAIVAKALGDRVSMWITHNEPWVMAWLGYGGGLFAPGIANLRKAAITQHHLLLSHGLAVEAIRAEAKNPAQIGIALNLHDVSPATDHESDVRAAEWVYGQQAESFLQPLFGHGYPMDVEPHSSVWSDPDVVRQGDLDVISRPIDFLGVNYYHPRFVCAPDRVGEAYSAGYIPSAPDHRESIGYDFVELAAIGTPKTDMGWPIAPEGLTRLLVKLKADYPAVPTYISENGAAFPDYVNVEGKVVDPERSSFIEGHLRAVDAALAPGVDVRGYITWSLMDNFEWASGYSKRFGIVYVDYPTQRRIPKQSAYWYRDVIAAGGLT